MYLKDSGISWHRRVNLICPICRASFEVSQSSFAARRKASGGKPICCCHYCAGQLKRQSVNSSGSVGGPSESSDLARPVGLTTHVTGKGRGPTINSPGGSRG